VRNPVFTWCHWSDRSLGGSHPGGTFAFMFSIQFEVLLFVDSYTQRMTDSFQRSLDLRKDFCEGVVTRLADTMIGAILQHREANSEDTKNRVRIERLKLLEAFMHSQTRHPFV